MKHLSLVALCLVMGVATQACSSNHSTTTTSSPTTETSAKPVSVSSENSTTETTSAKKQSIWIDVRSAEEYQAGHIAGAVNIPHTDIAQKISSITTDKDAEIHLYCRSGRRSDVALQELKKLGYTNITNQGAYDDLVKKEQK